MPVIIVKSKTKNVEIEQSSVSMQIYTLGKVASCDLQLLQFNVANKLQLHATLARKLPRAVAALKLHCCFYMQMECLFGFSRIHQTRSEFNFLACVTANIQFSANN